MSDERYRGLVHNIKTVGFLQPILVREREDGLHDVVDGNHRVMAAREVGLTDLPCVIAKMSVPLVILQRIGMNRLRGELTLTVVSEMLSECEGLSITDLLASGFTKDELESLLSVNKEDSEFDLDDILGPDDDESIGGDVPIKDPPQVHTLTVEFQDPDDYALVCKGLKRAGRGYRAGLLRLVKDFMEER